MDVTFPIPDLFVLKLGPGADIGRRALEALVLEEHRAGRLSDYEVGAILGFETRYETDDFLKLHGGFEQFALADLDRERAVMDRLGI